MRGLNPYRIFIFLLAISNFCFAQKEGKKNHRMVDLGAVDTLQDNYERIRFTNVNKVPFYLNQSDLETIKKLESNQKWERLYPLLRKYVSRFGVQNFYRNTYWLWRLAKLTEIYGSREEAVDLYKLVLKHHRDDIDVTKIQIFFDSINYDKKETYVPLEYYYELVEYRKEVDTLRPPRGVLLNMGKTVNSRFSDYGPTLNTRDNVLLFTSQRNRTYTGMDFVENEDLFFSVLENDFWTDAKPLKGINGPFNEGSACLSKSGRLIYFTRCNSPDSYGNCDLFSAELQADSTWGNIKNLGINVNSQSWDSHPSLSHTEDTLFFASDRMGGFGMSDIYFSYRNSKGEWAPAVNLGPIVNTRRNEVSPFYHPRFNVLYFSSNGHLLNFGEFDIFKSYWLDDQWQEPKNIGPLVNGERSEFYFTIDSNSGELYYAHSQENNMGNLDLYSFPLPMDAQPDATTMIHGSLLDATTGKPFNKGIVSIIDLDQGIEVAPKFLKPDGSFEFSLINNQNYLLIIQGEEFFRIEEIFFLDGEMEFNRVSNPISSKLKFESIEFENGKAELRAEMFYDLDKMAGFMLDNPDFKLNISGHTDGDGSKELNLKLSQERADAIKDYLVKLGKVPENRIVAEGFGSSKPIVPETSEENKRLNRRVEFEIYRLAQSELRKLDQEEKEKAEEQWGSPSP